MRAGLVVLLACLCLAPTAAAAASVKALGGYFDPETLDLTSGDEVTWTNDDSTAHTVTSSWDEGATFDIVLRAGESFSYQFTKAGTWNIHCRPHAGMGMMVTSFAIEPSANLGVPLAAEPSTVIEITLPFALALAVPVILGAAGMLRRRAREQ